MNQSKNRFLIVSTAAALAAMLATASILSGCGGGEGEAKETRVVTETQIVTKVVNGVFTDEEGNIIKDADGNPMTAPAGTPDTDAKEKSESEAKESKSNGEKSEAAESKSDDGDNGGSKSDDSKESKSSESKESKSSKSSKSEGGGSGEVLKVRYMSRQLHQLPGHSELRQLCSQGYGRQNAGRRLLRQRCQLQARRQGQVQRYQPRRI